MINLNDNYRFNTLHATCIHDFLSLTCEAQKQISNPTDFQQMFIVPRFQKLQPCHSLPIPFCLFLTFKASYMDNHPCDRTGHIVILLTSRKVSRVPHSQKKILCPIATQPYTRRN